MFVELVLREPDNDDFEVNYFWKDLTNLEKALYFQTGKFVSDRRTEIVNMLSEPSSVIAHKAPFWYFDLSQYKI